MARQLGGRFLVRIEDIDVARCREEHVAAIFEDLAWLGIPWEEPVLRQSQHFAVYARRRSGWRRKGVLYPCFASRSEIWEAANTGPLDPDGAPLYPGLHKCLPRHEIEARIEQGEPYALRLDMERALQRGRAPAGRPALDLHRARRARAPDGRSRPSRSAGATP